jgi:hypothetical protein
VIRAVVSGLAVLIVGVAPWSALVGLNLTYGPIFVQADQILVVAVGVQPDSTGPKEKLVGPVTRDRLPVWFMDFEADRSPCDSQSECTTIAAIGLHDQRGAKQCK